MKKISILILTTYYYMLNVGMAQQHWTLKQCVAHALANNLELIHQTQEIHIKDYDYRIARNERLPSVQGYSNLYSNFGHSQDVFGTIQRNDNLNSNMGITAEIMIYNFRSIKNQALRSGIQVNLQTLEKEVLQRELTTKVIQAYLEILMQQALVVARDSSVVFSEKLYQRARKTTEIGTTAQSVVYEARANLAREKQQLETVKVDLERARLQLAQLLQIKDYETISVAPLPDDAALYLWESPQLSELIAHSYSVHPSMKRYPLWKADIALQEKLIRAQYYPTIKGSTSIGSTYFNAFRIPQTNSFFLQTKNNFAQQVAITASIPIFNKGRTRNQIKQLQILNQQIDTKQKMEQQHVRQQLEKIFLDYKTNQQNLIQAQEAKLHTQLALNFAEKSYLAGQISIYELNTSRNNYILSEAELLRSKYSTLFSYNMLMYQVLDNFNDIATLSQY